MEATLIQDGEIQELLQILRLFKKGKEAGEVFELVTYIDCLEDKLGWVMDELTNVKRQLVEIKELNEKKPLKEVLSDAVEKLEENCKQMKESLMEIKNEVLSKARGVVRSVKEKGIIGLNKLSGFLGIRDKLGKMKSELEQNIFHVDTVIRRIDNAGLQFKKATIDIRNIGRALSGKEKVEIKEKIGFSFVDVIKSPWEMNRKRYGSMLNHIDLVIEKVEELSRRVDFIKEKRNDGKVHTIYEEERKCFIETHFAEDNSYVSNSEAFEAFQTAYENDAVKKITSQTPNKNLDRIK